LEFGEPGVDVQGAGGVEEVPPGVGAQVGGLGQRGQAEGERQPVIVGQRPGVGDAGLVGALGQQQRPAALPGS
jgi:hypothetical protein